jgi:hypothetical protein
MKKILITKGKFVLVDNDDFIWLSKQSWCSHSKGYAIGWDKENKKVEMMHRIIMHTSKGMDTDHINGNRLDNRRKNLRICTRSQNLANYCYFKSKSCNYKGVTKLQDKVKTPNKWMAQIGKDNKNIFLGLFPTAKMASMAYNKKAKELFGDFAKLG